MDKALKIDKIIKILGGRVDTQFEYITTDLSLNERVVNPYHRFNHELEGNLQGSQQINFYMPNGYFNYKKKLLKNTLVEISVPAGYKLSEIKTDIRLLTYFILLNKPNKNNYLRYIYHASVDQTFEISGYLVEDYNSKLYSELRSASTNNEKRIDIAFTLHTLQKNLGKNTETKRDEIRRRYSDFFRDIISEKIYSDSALYPALEKIIGKKINDKVEIFDYNKEYIPARIFKLCSSTYSGNFPRIHKDSFRDIFEEIS